MSDSAGWFARHLGGEQQSAPSQAPPLLPQQYQQPAPAVHQPQQVPQQPQQMPAQQPQQTQQTQQTQQMPQLTVGNFTKAMNYWQGGEAMKTETRACPKCGSGHFFSRQQSGGVMGKAPSPMCFDCGYNEVYHQETVA